MSEFAIAPTTWTPERRAGLAAIALLALTSVHHVYGAIVFDTPWRLHILYAAVPAGILIAALLYFAERRSRESSIRMLRIVAAAIILIFPVAAIGLYEGGYNHLFKNGVYFLAGEERALAMFPPPTYEMPGDFFFEMTGIMQFPLSIVTAIGTLALLRRR